MGTRAMVSIDGVPFVATHWDGYPTGLGAALKGAKTEDEILVVAEMFSINFVRADLVDRFKGNDILVESIDFYGDFSEWQYDLNSKTGRWRYRKLGIGSWPGCLKEAYSWGGLNEKNLNKEASIGS